MKLTKIGYTILLFWLLALAAVAMSFSSCTSQRGGCKATSGMSGYGH